ncbi:MAG: trehalose-phosphatase [Methyloceanibacter sp.]
MQRGIAPRRHRSSPLPSPAAIDLRRTALLLDVDGTLLDIATTPETVIVPDTLQAALRNLIALANGAVALVSGRTIASLDRLFAPLRVPAIGGHGAEMRVAPDGTVVKHHLPDLSEVLRERLHALSAIDPRLLIEDKLHSIAVHYRLAHQHEDVLKAKVADIVSAGGDHMEILSGKAVIEVKPRHFTKGSAVIELMTQPPFKGRIPLFLGDDTTDESVFAILPELSGSGFSVGRAIAGADGVIPSPGHVRSWLTELSSHAGRRAT